MAFDDSVITGERLTPRGADLVVSWASSAPAGTVYQVYCGDRLAWSGTATRCVIPAPAERTRIAIGAVDAAEEPADMTGDGGYPSVVADRVRLEWSGGTYLAEDIASFAIYAGNIPGGAVSYTTPVGRVPVANGTAVDGFGVGGFGEGGFGRSAGAYRWTSRPIGTGAWNFGIKARRANGAEATAATGSATLAVPPRPVEPFSDGTRLRLNTYNSGTRVATVAFNASPGDSSPSGGEYDRTTPVEP